MVDHAWETLEHGARWALKHARDISPTSRVQGMGPLLRLWTYPARETYGSWTILVPVGSEQRSRPMVREIVWNRRQDKRHLAAANRKRKVRTKLQPTIHVRDADISSEDLNPFLAAAACLFVPAKPLQDFLPLESISGLEGHGSLAYLRMEWQGPGPVEWADIILWVARLRNLLVASLTERETGRA